MGPQRIGELTNTRLALASLASAAGALTLAACAPVLPTYDAIRDETRAAMQEIVDEIPAGSEVDDLSTETPFGCQGDGVVYTGHWAVYPEPPFDSQAFVDGLTEALDGTWAANEDALESPDPSVSLLKDDMLIRATAVDDDGRMAVDILALSRCGQSPTPVPGW